MKDKLKKIEDFPGVVILANEDGIVTKEKLDELVAEYREWDEMVNGGSFTTWLEFRITPLSRKTSEEWEKEIPERYKLIILDPDGWDRTNYDYSFREELITKEEFDMRLSNSTISCTTDFFTRNMK